MTNNNDEVSACLTEEDFAFEYEQTVQTLESIMETLYQSFDRFVHSSTKISNIEDGFKSDFFQPKQASSFEANLKIGSLNTPLTKIEGSIHQPKKNQKNELNKSNEKTEISQENPLEDINYLSKLCNSDYDSDLNKKSNDKNSHEIPDKAKNTTFNSKSVEKEKEKDKDKLNEDDQNSDECKENEPENEKEQNKEKGKVKESSKEKGKNKSNENEKDKTIVENKKLKNGSIYGGEWKNGKPEGQGILVSNMGYVYNGEFSYGKFNGLGVQQQENGLVYRGYWKIGKMGGKAIITFPNKDTYIGTIKDNKFEGEGIRRFANGDMYKGQYSAGLQHGNGIFISMQEGWRYQGQWAKGKIFGRGTCVWNDGTVYDGMWVNWMKEGPGKLVLSDKTTYVGDFQNDLPNGKGVKIFPDGSKYIGTFVNSNFQGSGLFQWSDGCSYKGLWETNKIQGEGQLILKSGTIINGNFNSKNSVIGIATKIWQSGGKEYKYVGELGEDFKVLSGGEFFWPDGRTYKGEIKNGLMNGIGKYSFQDEFGGQAIYNGQMISNEMSGQGTIQFSNANIYAGEFLNNQFNGNGTLTTKDASYTGYFKNGLANGKGILTTSNFKYEGDFEKGVFEGHGKIEFSNKDSYLGKFHKNMYEGYGYYKSECGIEIKGLFSKGKCCAYGMKIFPNGIIYEGQMQDDQPNGLGRIRKLGGGAKFGRWKKGSLVKSTNNAQENLDEDNCEEQGKIKRDEKVFPIYYLENELLNGNSRIVYSNGNIYEGFVKDGLREGEAKLITEQGIIEGKWENNILEDYNEAFCVPIEVVRKSKNNLQ